MNKTLAALSAATALAISQPATAATFTVSPKSNGGTDIIVLGQINYGDDRQFEAIIPPDAQTTVVLNSPGGNLAAGLAIGWSIHTHGFATVVRVYDDCSSVCALAWLGGKPRYIQEGARIGFHAAYDADTLEVTGSGNAIVGAYLNQLGLSIQAIAWLTSAQPDQVADLSFAKAQELGITVRHWPPTPTCMPDPEHTVHLKKLYLQYDCTGVDRP